MTTALVEYELVGSDGAALLAADDDFFLLDVAIAAVGSDVTPTLDATQGLYGRSVTVTLTDANSSITALKVWLTGTDTFGRAISETLTFAGSGTETVESVLAYRTLTSVVYHADGVISSDTIKIGYGNILGLPRTISSVSDILKARVGSTAYEDPTTGAGTFTPTPLGGTGSTWEPLGGVVPDGANRYYVQFAETIS